MSENDQGFTVNDRRTFRPGAPEGDKPEGDKGNENAQTSPEATLAHDPAAGKTETDPNASRNLPPVTFRTLIISLAHAAMLHMGHLEDAQGAPTERNLDLARHTIDTMAMLKDKTTGNLDQEEQAFLDGILTELRMLYVQICKNPR